ncbi:MAG: transglycosylase SLT domain-containing protein [Terriglobales bacterium]
MGKSGRLQHVLAPVVLLVLASAAVACHIKAPAPAPPAPSRSAAAPPATVLMPASPSPAIPNPPQVLPAAPVPAPEHPDQIGILIAAVEQQYQAALQLDRAGQLDEARQGFDVALDHLLSSPYDIPATPRLQAELTSLLDRIQALESDALPAGGFSQAQPQTSLKRILQLTFPLDPATKARLEAKARVALARQRRGQLPLTVNDPVLRYVHYFTTRGRSDLLQGFRRAGRYRAMVDRIFTADGIPTDLIYLAQLESGFDPRLTSRAGARGMWQFMSLTGEGYGLKRNHWVDERMDPIMSTRAAAEHLKSLYSLFGNWYLAMAAYNTGEVTIERIVARTGYADYFKLYKAGILPRSWRNYVPIILAIALIAQNPSEYGIASPDPDPPYSPDQVKITAPEDLRLAAECAGVTVADLERLNPALLHDLVPEHYTLKLPRGTMRHYEKGMAAIPAPDRVYWRLHWVKRGETWRELAHRYHISERKLQRANHLSATHAPPPGMPLALPHRVLRRKF